MPTAISLAIEQKSLSHDHLNLNLGNTSKHLREMSGRALYDIVYESKMLYMSGSCEIGADANKGLIAFCDNDTYEISNNSRMHRFSHKRLSIFNSIVVLG